ncbi:SRPBCC family protein [Arachidicoccus sp.]|jgi:uncharacterized protein YndB with AHSA1/START domain|uniref:SRPBCC family protein n=1 Tax=Arachidicoccus sp. TaxID=1872624 RepID=UPI003D2293B3
MNSEPLIVEQVFNASIENVWSAITSFDEMREWYFPMLQSFDPVVGFETKFTVENNGMEYLHVWKVDEVIPLKKISYEWKFGGYPGNSLLSFELYARNSETLLILMHSKLESFRGDIYPDLTKENFSIGWHQIIGKNLVDYIQNKGKK